MKKNLGAAKLARNHPPATAENLKLFLGVDADTDAKALWSAYGVGHIPDWLIATDNDDRPAECLCGRVPLAAPAHSRFWSRTDAVPLTRHQRSSPMILFPSASLASHTLHFAPPGVVNVIGLS